MVPIWRMRPKKVEELSVSEKIVTPRLNFHYEYLLFPILVQNILLQFKAKNDNYRIFHIGISF